MKSIDTIYIKGQFVTPHGTERFTLVDPVTEQKAAHVILADEVDADNAIAAATSAYHELAGSSREQRMGWLARLHEVVANAEVELTATMIEEYGGPHNISVATSRRAAASFDQARALLADYQFERQVASARVRMESLGVVGLITPWNANYGMICSKLAMAIAAGSTAVIKPSELSARQTDLLTRVLHRAELPPGLFNILTGRGDVVGAAFVRHPGIAKISFTGSTAVGKSIVRGSAETLKRVTLELGGKSPMTMRKTPSPSQTTRSMACMPMCSRAMLRVRIASHAASRPAGSSSMACTTSRWRRSVDSSSRVSDVSSAYSGWKSISNQRPCWAMNNRSERVLLGQLLDTVRERYAGAGDSDDLPTALPWLGLVRRRAPTPIGRGMLEPSMCLMLQGEKQMLVGERVLRYGAGCYVQAGTAMPVSGQVVRASDDEAYYGIRVDLDPKELASFLLEMRIPMPSHDDDPPFVSVERAEWALLETLERLLRLLNRPSDLPVLGRLLKQEIMYHLVTGPGGPTLTRGLMGGQRESAVNKAIGWIREHYDVPLRIAELAEAVHLSPSVLHRRFKAATIMSPLQYQKQVRLLEARKLLMGGGIEAANVAFQVGYESPSQFSREYRRLFGASPIQDAEQLRGVMPSP